MFTFGARAAQGDESALHALGPLHRQRPPVT